MLLRVAYLVAELGVPPQCLQAVGAQGQLLLETLLASHGSGLNGQTNGAQSGQRWWQLGHLQPELVLQEAPQGQHVRDNPTTYQI